MKGVPDNSKVTEPSTESHFAETVTEMPSTTADKASTPTAKAEAPTTAKAPPNEGAPPQREASIQNQREATQAKQSAPTKTAEPSPQLNISETPSNAVDESAPEKSMFRETQWFMKADDQDHIEAIENYGAGELAPEYDDKGDLLSTQVREAFSLNPAGDSPDTVSPQSDPALTTSTDFAAEVSGGRNQKLVFGIAIAVIAGILAAIFI